MVRSKSRGSRKENIRKEKLFATSRTFPLVAFEAGPGELPKKIEVGDSIEVGKNAVMWRDGKRGNAVELLGFSFPPILLAKVMCMAAGLRGQLEEQGWVERDIQPIADPSHPGKRPPHFYIPQGEVAVFKVLG